MPSPTTSSAVLAEAQKEGATTEIDASLDNAAMNEANISSPEFSSPILRRARRRQSTSLSLKEDALRVSLTKQDEYPGRPSEDKSNADGIMGCHCKKSKCLKLYCDCFAASQYCFDCNCRSCFNVESHETERQAAIKAALERKPNAFTHKISHDEHLSGCRCKKIKCLKKYCECFEAGIRCAEHCKCLDCENYEVPLEPKQAKDSKTGASGLSRAAVVTPSDIDIATPYLAKSRAHIQMFVREFSRETSSSSILADDTVEAVANEDLTSCNQAKEAHALPVDCCFKMEDLFQGPSTIDDKTVDQILEAPESLNQSSTPSDITEQVARTSPAHVDDESSLCEFNVQQQPQVSELGSYSPSRPNKPATSEADLTITIATRLRAPLKRSRSASNSTLVEASSGGEKSNLKRARIDGYSLGTCHCCGVKLSSGALSTLGETFCSQACMNFTGLGAWDNVVESSDVLELTVEEEAGELLGEELGDAAHHDHGGHSLAWGSNAQQFFETLNDIDPATIQSFDFGEIAGDKSQTACLKKATPKTSPSPSTPKLKRELSRSPRSAGKPGKCEVCKTSHDGSCGTGRFCSLKCRNRCNGSKASKSPKSKSPEPS